jgi:hypothetical protein
VNYELRVRRDVPTVTWFFLGALLLLVPPILVTWRSFAFEQRRWQESDYGAIPL